MDLRFSLRYTLLLSRCRSKLLVIFSIVFITFALSPAANAQTDSGPRAWIVTAHPDDEVNFAVTVYKITHDLHGVVDLALVTNGEGGYKYSTLAESVYGLELTDEKVGRQYLPTIRKQELMAGGKIGVLSIHCSENAVRTR